MLMLTSCLWQRHCGAVSMTCPAIDPSQEHCHKRDYSQSEERLCWEANVQHNCGCSG